MKLPYSIKSIFTFTFIFLISSQVLSQKIEPVKQQAILIEKNFLPNDHGIQLYLSFKIPYNNLVFVKKEEKFYAGLKVEFELIHSNRIVKRESVSKNIAVNEYENTKSTDRYLESAASFILDKDVYTILPTLTIENTNNTYVLDSIKINPKDYVKENIFFPLIIEQNQKSCSDSLLFKIANFQNSIPFSTNDYFLLVPINDSTIKKVDVKIEQNDKSIYEITVDKFEEDNLKIKNCNEFVGLFYSSEDKKTKYFIIDKFSNKLYEGSAKLIITKNDYTKIEYDLNITWENKPKSLNNIEFAIQILETIEDKDKISKLFRGSEKDLYQSLINYWDKKFPNRKYAFNDLMNEFYKRVDYAMENFSTVTNRNGAKTDRGKVYIKYGKPDKILRDYSDSKVAEIWIYNNINKQFIFIDNSGLGNYILEQ